eukprot:1152869-Pelagomonas_calceolata.AAC.4
MDELSPRKYFCDVMRQGQGALRCDMRANGSAGGEECLQVAHLITSQGAKWSDQGGYEMAAHLVTSQGATWSDQGGYEMVCRRCRLSAGLPRCKCSKTALRGAQAGANGANVGWLLLVDGANG